MHYERLFCDDVYRSLARSNGGRLKRSEYVKNGIALLQSLRCMWVALPSQLPAAIHHLLLLLFLSCLRAIG